jgi:hypothetical protein
MGQPPSDYEKQELLRSDWKAFWWSALLHYKELSGGLVVSIILGYAAVAIFGVPEWAAGVVGFAVCVVLAAFFAFRDQRQLAEDLASKDSCPRFIGRVFHVHLVDFPKFGPCVFMYLSIRNLGSPSIAFDYSCVHEIPGVETSKAQLMTLMDDMVLPTGGKISASDDIVRKAGVIPSGDIREGMMLLKFPNRTPEQLQAEDGSYIISYHDVTGKRYTATAATKSERRIADGMPVQLGTTGTQIGNPLEIGKPPNKKQKKTR